MYPARSCSPVVGYFLLCGCFRGLYVRQKLRFVLIDLRLRGRSAGRDLIPPGLPISLKLGLIGRYLLLIRGHIGAMAQCILRQSLLVRLKLVYVRLYPRLCGLSVGRNLILFGLSVLLKLGLIVLHLLLGSGRFAGGLRGRGRSSSVGLRCRSSAAGLSARGRRVASGLCSGRRCTRQGPIKVTYPWLSASLSPAS